MKNLIIFIVLLAAFGYGYSKYGEPLLNKIQQKDTASEEQLDALDKELTEADIKHSQAIWTFRDAGIGEADTPKNEITLTYNGVEHVLGVHDGDCFLIEESSWTLLPNEETGVICWWAGGGTEIGVFKRNGVVTVEEGLLDEGGEEYKSFRGDFRIIKAL